MYKTHRSKIHTFLLFISLVVMSGCAQHKENLPAEPTVVPEITSAYLLEHRIISYQPKYQEKMIMLPPYEIKTFEESYILYLIARIPDNNSTTLLKKEPLYYLWIKRSANSWRDFTAVYSSIPEPLKINAHYSDIRQGLFHKEYTIDFTLEQLSGVQDAGLDLRLVNQQNFISDIHIPSIYIKAYVEMIAQISK